jgi:predicted N-acetyltransferase YhbS
MTGLATAGLTFRRDYFSDAVAFDALVDLLRDTFGIDISLQNRFGGPDPTSMPFGYFDEAGRCVANFSAFTMPLMINGRLVKAAGYQSGAVRPEFRGQGLYRDLMRQAFSWARETGHEIGILLTDKPAMYEPYGFRSVEQHKFFGPLPKREDGTMVARTLDLGQQEDIDLAMRILGTRQSVSDRFAPVRQEEMFLLNSCFDPSVQLSYIEALDCIIAWKTADETLVLFDIVSPKVPPLLPILNALGADALQLEILFPPDRLGWDGEKQIYKGYCDLMIAGTDLENLPDAFMLSPMAEF